MKDFDITFEYDNEQHMALCSITYKGETFYGTASCHPQDFDMESERTGSYIAELRAKIHVFQFIRDYELKPAYEALNHLLHTMLHSKNFDSKSYEAKRIYKEIANYKNDIDTIGVAIHEYRDLVHAYINEKDKVYQRIRKARSK